METFSMADPPGSCIWLGIMMIYLSLKSIKVLSFDDFVLLCLIQSLRLSILTIQTTCILEYNITNLY